MIPDDIIQEEYNWRAWHGTPCTKGYNNTVMIAERGKIQFFFRYIAKDRRGAKEMNNYQSYRTKKDTLSFTIHLFFPLFCDLTTRYHYAVCSFLRRHVISAQVNILQATINLNALIIQFISPSNGHWSISKCSNEARRISYRQQSISTHLLFQFIPYIFIISLFYIHTFIYFFYLSRRIM